MDAWAVYLLKKDTKVELTKRQLLIIGQICDAPVGKHMIRFMNMSDIYVQYEVSSTTRQP
jgi:hypothetical protein